LATKATEFGEITQTTRPLRRSRSFKVTDFGINRKPIYDFLVVINTNLSPILHCFQLMADYMSNFRSDGGSFAKPSLGLVQGSCQILLQNEDFVWLVTCSTYRPARVAMTWIPVDGKWKIGTPQDYVAKDVQAAPGKSQHFTGRSRGHCNEPLATEKSCCPVCRNAWQELSLS